MPLPKDPAAISEWKRKVGIKTMLGKKYSLQIVKSTDLPEPSEINPEVKRGIYLVPPHGELIWKGEKKAIVKTREFNIREPLFLVSGNLVYGIIMLSPPTKITKEEFDNLRDKHRITEKEYEKWGWKGKPLYYYKVEMITRFDPPKKAKIKKGTQTFIKKVEFLAVIRKDINPADLNNKELLLAHAKLHAMFKHKPHNWSLEDIVNLHVLVQKEMERRNMKHIDYDDLDKESKRFLSNLIKNPKTYDPSKLSDEVLLDDHRIVHAWWSSLQQGKKLYHSDGSEITKEEVRKLHDAIVKELEKRGFEHKTPLEEHLSETPDRIKKLCDKLEDAVIIENFVSLIGSFVTNKEKPNDIDFLLRFDRGTPEFIERATKVRIAKMLESVAEDLHFTADPEGPHDDYVPIYDLVLRKRKPELVNLSSKSQIPPENYFEFEKKVVLGKPYLPQKPYGSAFYEIEDALKHLKEGKKYSIEFKYNGFHAVAHKIGKDVKIFSEQLKDLSAAFPTLREEIYKLAPDHDFIIDGELVPYSKSGKALGRNPLMKFIGAVKSGKKLDDSLIKFHVFDITYFDKPINDLPLKERQEYLSKLKFSDRVQRVKYKIADAKNAKEAIEWASGLKGSEGAVIKDLDAPYSFGETSKSWIKFRHLVDIHALVLEKIKKEQGFNYLIGIYVSEEQAKKIHPKYLIKFKGKNVLVLGHTFNTKEEVEPGKIIDVALEDVWRHVYPSIKKVRYSIHKPRFRQIRPDLKDTSSIDDLEDIVTSIGEEVVEE